MSDYPFSFDKTGNKLICTFYHEYEIYSVQPWIKIKRLFQVEEKDIIDSTGDTMSFAIAELNENYFRLDKKICNLQHDFYIHKNIKIQTKLFLSHRSINILHKLDAIISKSLYICDDQPGTCAIHDTEPYNAITINKYLELIKKFPNSSELTKYQNMRIETILSEDVNFKKSYRAEYKDYMNRKPSKKPTEIPHELYQNEVEKYRLLHEQLINMLSDEDKYSEEKWQQQIVEFVLLLFPKYCYVLEKVTIHTEQGDKKPDLLLVDSDGNVDVIEIKKPADVHILTENNSYRNNYIPRRDFSGGIMQLEKYIYWLSRNGKKSEEIIQKELDDKYGIGHKLSIHIRNPRGIFILGRTSKFNDEQKRDFEIIRRKYKNITDVFSYDDLLQMLDRLIKKFEKPKAK